MTQLEPQPGVGSSDAPEFTVVVCAREPACLLEETLWTLAEMRVPAGRTWEIVVAGYQPLGESELESECVREGEPESGSECSTSAPSVPTRRLVEQFADQLPIRYLETVEIGIAAARRGAVKVSRGEWLIFTDCQVHIQPDFLRQYVAGRERYPSAVLFRGTVVPRYFRFTPPDWLRRGARHVGAAWGCLENWKAPFELGPKLLPVGANLAVRRDAYLPYLRQFDAVVSADVASQGEVDDVICQMLADGLPGYWLPDATVYRLIRPEQATMEYLREFYFQLGRSLAASHDAGDTKSRSWLEAWRRECIFQIARVTGRPDSWVRHMQEASRHWGMLSGMTSPTVQSTPADSRSLQVRRAA